MSEGEEIVRLMRELHCLYRESANLLQAADGLFMSKGWSTPTDSTCKTGSNSLSKPEAWFAQDVHRFYKRSDDKHERLLTFISVIFYDRDEPSRITEPLVTTGLFDYGSDKKVENKWDYFFARAHLSMPSRRDDGKINSLTQVGIGVPYLTATTIGVPLMSIKSEHDLCIVVDRLFEEVSAVVEDR